MDELKKLVESIEQKGEQLWWVRIAPKENGKVERWLIAPITEPNNETDSEKRIIDSLKSAISEDDGTEYWDCENVSVDENVKWVCHLRKKSKVTRAGGHVFKIEG